MGRQCFSTAQAEHLPPQMKMSPFFLDATSERWSCQVSGSGYHQEVDWDKGEGGEGQEGQRAYARVRMRSSLLRWENVNTWQCWPWPQGVGFPLPCSPSYTGMPQQVP